MWNVLKEKMANILKDQLWEQESEQCFLSSQLSELSMRKIKRQQHQGLVTSSNIAQDHILQTATH